MSQGERNPNLNPKSSLVLTGGDVLLHRGSLFHRLELPVPPIHSLASQVLLASHSSPLWAINRKKIALSLGIRGIGAGRLHTRSSQVLPVWEALLWVLGSCCEAVMVGKHQGRICKEVCQTNSNGQAYKSCELPLAMTDQVASSKESLRNLTTDSGREKFTKKSNLLLPLLRQWTLKVCVTASSVPVYQPGSPGHPDFFTAVDVDAVAMSRPMWRSFSDIPKRGKYTDLKDVQMSRRDTGVEQLVARAGNSDGVRVTHGEEWRRSVYEPLYVPLMNQGDPWHFTLGLDWAGFVNARNNSDTVEYWNLWTEANTPAVSKHVGWKA